MPKYKIGDRVVITSPFEQSGRTMTPSWYLTILTIDDRDYGCKLDRQYFAGLHDLNNLIERPYTGWWINIAMLDRNSEFEFGTENPDWEV